MAGSHQLYGGWGGTDGAQKPVKEDFVKMWMTDNEVCARVVEGDVLTTYEAELTGLGVEEEEGRGNLEDYTPF